MSARDDFGSTAGTSRSYSGGAGGLANGGIGGGMSAGSMGGGAGRLGGARKESYGGYNSGMFGGLADMFSNMPKPKPKPQVQVVPTSLTYNPLYGPQLPKKQFYDRVGQKQFYDRILPSQQLGLEDPFHQNTRRWGGPR
jgi:hypothetical protein